MAAICRERGYPVDFYVNIEGQRYLAGNPQKGIPFTMKILNRFAYIRPMSSSLSISLEGTLADLRALSDHAHLEKMQRFGIDSSTALGISIPALRKLARKAGRNHLLALQLWDTNIHEARILASMVDDPAQVTLEQSDRWVHDFHSWDVCDQVCGNLLDKTPFAYTCIPHYSKSSKEYVKRAAFVLMAELAVHDKMAKDASFLSFLPIIEREAGDERNFVKKAVNWALRQIGKRNAFLHQHALHTAYEISLQKTAVARWIARDAIKELESPAVLRKVSPP